LTSKRFFFTTLAVLALLCLLAAGLNARLNGYGVFRDCEGEELTIYVNERTTKYLFAHNYIPTNFEGLLIGSSQSANLDTSKLRAARVYNGSITGGNITELKLIVEETLKQGELRYLIVCLSNYIVKNHGRKTSYMVPEEYWGVLGSLETIKHYVRRLRIALDPSRQKHNEFGQNDFCGGVVPEAPEDIEEDIRSRAAGGYEFEVDKVALKELDGTLQLARSKGVRVFAFFYPVPEFRLKLAGDSFEEFREQVSSVLGEGDVVWDFNEGAHGTFGKAYLNYCDRGHLSDQGAAYVLEVIDSRLRTHISSESPSFH